MRSSATSSRPSSSPAAASPADGVFHPLRAAWADHIPEVLIDLGGITCWTDLLPQAILSHARSVTNRTLMVWWPGSCCRGGHQSGGPVKVVNLKGFPAGRKVRPVGWPREEWIGVNEYPENQV